MVQSCDVLIVGGGPAGTSCALALHNSGLRVVLADKSSFPRHKICGDAIPANSFKVMDKINADWGKTLRQFSEKEEIQSSKLYMPGNKTILINWVLYAYNSKRIDFDNFLMKLVKKETSTQVYENKRLKDIQQNRENALCTFEDGTELKASIVIGCDGANSVVKKLLAPADSKDTNCAAVRLYACNIKGQEAGTNEFHFFKERITGYFWIFPLAEGWSNVGYGILQNPKKKEHDINLRHRLKQIIESHPNIASRFKNAEITDDIKGFSLPLSTHKKPVSGIRYMLCGDAASLVDPLQGHGIDKAMWSGFYAAKQAVQCFEKNDFSEPFMENYDKALYRHLWPELKRSAILLRLFAKMPRLVNLLTGLLQNRVLTQKLIRLLKI